MLKVVIHYPAKADEQKIIRQNLAADFPKPNHVLKPADITSARKVVSDVYMDAKIENYILDIVFAIPVILRNTSWKSMHL